MIFMKCLYNELIFTNILTKMRKGVEESEKNWRKMGGTKWEEGREARGIGKAYAID